MNALDLLTALSIDSPLVTRAAANFRPHSWPPPRDFPIVIDAKGKVVSTYGDTSWRLWPWAKKPLVLNFGDGPKRRNTSALSSENADLLRQIAAWWIYGPKAVRTAQSLKARFTLLRSIFVLCSQHGIAASDIVRFPAVADEIPSVISRSQSKEVLWHLHKIFEHREQLGFTLLDREGLIRLEAALPEHEERQTPYIPPRIWLYQINRLRAFLDDFNAHRQEVEGCFHYCMNAYAKNAGSLADACDRKIPRSRKPFNGSSQVTGARSGLQFCGRFSDAAERFGIDGLLQRWLLQPGESIDGAGHGLKLLGAYFSMVGYVGTAYLLNFSMMRIEEGWSLRSDCLVVEQDRNFGPIYLLVGPTTKMYEDGDARWVTSPSAKVAVDAMTSVARLRTIAAEANTTTPTIAEDICNPYLVVRGYEPWANAKGCDLPLEVRPMPMTYAEVCRSYPNLFDLNQLRITEADLQIARLITPTLDGEEFLVGKIWPLAWHQLRRTGAVNMQASGLVSDSSVQYQLKHTRRAMSLFYGQGYSQLRFNEEARNEYIRTMYEILGKEIALLFSDRFVSPHGDQRKSEILGLVGPKDNMKLANAARSGNVAWRETLLGGCTKRGPCSYGGVDNIIRCGGGDGRTPCIDAMFDRDKAPAVRELHKLIASRLAEAPDGSPYRESLEAQKRATEYALNAII